MGDIMNFLYIVICSASSFIFLFLIAKAMGFRAIGELSFFDYVIGITIGSIAAEMATNLELEWWKSVVAMVIYGIFSIVLSKLSEKSIIGRKVVSGTPIILMDNGKIRKNMLKKAKIDITDLLTQARENGFFDLSNVDYAIMETNGKISFLPKQTARPLQPTDFNFTTERKGLCVNVIVDGKVLEQNLKDAGMTKKELERRLRQNGKKTEDLFLATVNLCGEMSFFEK